MLAIFQADFVFLIASDRNFLTIFPRINGSIIPVNKLSGSNLITTGFLSLLIFEEPMPIGTERLNETHSAGRANALS